MQVLFESRHPEGAPLRDLAVHRVRFVMRRLAWGVPRARVRLSDDNGPRGGVDKRCQVELSTTHAGTLVFTTVARDWRTALDQALARAARAVVRQLRRQQAQQLGLPAHPAPRMALAGVGRAA
jgi:hypothetical protein